MKEFLLTLTITGSLLTLWYLEAADNEYKTGAYKEMYADIKSMYPDRNQLCQQGAALVLIGNHEIADKHMQLEGECISKIVLNHYSK